MDTRFHYINEALAAIELREEALCRILTSETGFELYHKATGARFQAMSNLRVKLHTKHKHYLECENFIVNIM